MIFSQISFSAWLVASCNIQVIYVKIQLSRGCWIACEITTLIFTSFLTSFAQYLCWSDKSSPVLKQFTGIHAKMTDAAINLHTVHNVFVWYSTIKIPRRFRAISASRPNNSNIRISIPIGI